MYCIQCGGSHFVHLLCRTANSEVYKVIVRPTKLSKHYVGISGYVETILWSQILIRVNSDYEERKISGRKLRR